VEKPDSIFFCYIIYSKFLNRYCIGYSCDIEERLSFHNSGYFGGKSFTHRSNDWEVYILIPCESIEQAIFLEQRIKKMKSRIYIENLKKYPELIEKIMKEFNNQSI